MYLESKILFIYDDLMLKQVQEKARLPLKFVTFARTKGLMYKISDTKNIRHFILPQKNKLFQRKKKGFVYGGLYVVKKFDELSASLHSFYNSSIPYLGDTEPNDYYKTAILEVQPIRFKSISDIKTIKYTATYPIKSLTFVGNDDNMKIAKTARDSRNRIHYGFDPVNFIKLIEEVNYG